MTKRNSRFKLDEQVIHKINRTVGVIIEIQTNIDDTFDYYVDFKDSYARWVSESSISYVSSSE
jgi:hypothetical protein